jgi:Sulfotransferase domain
VCNLLLVINYFPSRISTPEKHDEQKRRLLSSDWVTTQSSSAHELNKSGVAYYSTLIADDPLTSPILKNTTEFLHFQNPNPARIQRSMNNSSDVGSVKHQRRNKNYTIPINFKVVSNVAKLDRATRKARRENQFNPGLGLNHQPIPLHVNLPVFIASLPKAGTTSIWQYFNCGGYSGSHQYVKINDTYSELSADCIRRNVQTNRPTFENCGSYSVYADTGLALIVPPTSKRGRKSKRYARMVVGTTYDKLEIDCYYPSIQALDSIYQHYPNATIILVRRNSTNWYHSMKNWGNGSLFQRWTHCNIPNFPTVNATTEHDFVQFYDWHDQNVRNFALRHPSITYVEISLESSDTGSILEQTIGIPKTCWGKCTPSAKWCERLVQ